MVLEAHGLTKDPREFPWDRNEVLGVVGDPGKGRDLQILGSQTSGKPTRVLCVDISLGRWELLHVEQTITQKSKIELPKYLLWRKPAIL